MRHLPPPGEMPPGMPPGMPGMPPGMPGMPPGMRPPGAPGQPPAQQQVGGGNEDCNWKRDGEEVEVTVSVPNKATKANIKVIFARQELKVLHCGEVLAEGKLGA